MSKRIFCDSCKKAYLHSTFIEYKSRPVKVGYFCTYCGSFKRVDSFLLGKEKDRLTEQGRIVEKMKNSQKEEAEARKQLQSLGVRI